MLKVSAIPYRLIALCLLWVGGNSLYAQKSMHYKERVLLGSLGITESVNPAFLQNIKDSILFTAEGTYSYGKGSFVNYFEPNNSYELRAETNSYNRLNDKLVVYGWASYASHKGKNAGGSSFMYPYKTPFNFIEKDENTKGDRKIERYHLIGTMSYKFSRKFDIGFSIDYESLNFAKLRDIRNLNQILDLKADVGGSHHFSENSTIGVSYRYKRYIEEVRFMQEGNAREDYYALVSKGTFMGLVNMYDKYSGILEKDTKAPWVAIAHNLSLQYQYVFSKRVRFFTEFSYEKEKGHFGNEGNTSIMYFRHNKTIYNGLLKFVREGDIIHHLITPQITYERTQNKERLYQEGTTPGNMTFISYYGENEVFNSSLTTVSLKYDFLFGEDLIKSPWHIDFNYIYKKRDSKTSFYPYLRKQKMSWQEIALGISRLFKVNRTDFSARLGATLGTGSGGNPIDRTYTNGGGTTNPPDYMNELLYKEKEYLTGKRLMPNFTVQAERALKSNTRIFVKINASYIKPFAKKYLEGNYFSTNIAFGLNF